MSNLNRDDRQQQPEVGGITPFDFHSHQVRVLTAEDGEPRWVAADVSAVLGYSATAAMTRSLDEDEKGVQILHTPGGDQSMTVITESGLYTAVLKSRVPGAAEFRRWVTREVLPSIRKHGGYLTEQKVEDILTDPDTIIQLATNLKEERARRAEIEQRNAVIEPKAEAYDDFMDATGKYGVGAVAKMLGTSQNKLFRDLRNAGVLISKGTMRNTPYQKYMHHFDVKAHEYERSNGEMGCSYTTYVQPSGVDFIRKKLGYSNLLGGAA